MLATIAQSTLICGVSYVLWKYFRQVFVRSPLDNVPGPAPESFKLGNLGQLVNPNGWDFLEYLTESYPGIAKLAGPLGHRMLYVFDPTALHAIVVKDQYVFEETQWFIKGNNLHFGTGLLSTLGDKHRKQRKMLNPVFSIAHMRHMIPIFNEVTHRLVIAIERRVDPKAGSSEIDLLQWMGRTALELIGQAGLGYSFDPLVADKSDAFADAIKNFQPTLMRLAIIRRVIPLLPGFYSLSLEWQRRLMALVPHAGVHKLSNIVDTLRRRSIDIFEEKKAALERGDEAVTRQIGEGKDIISILLRANMGAHENDRLPEEELIGQMSTLVLAAMDTTSTALSITFTLLAKHQDIQEKLRAEILEALGDREDFNYDELHNLPYLDAVCRETLRLFPPVSNLFRETREDAVLPLSQPLRMRDGTEAREIAVPKDTSVCIAIRSANRNKAIWGEDALEWKPERWLAPLPETVQDARVPGVYSNLMTFLGGGRACIGFKFSQLEMKVVMCLLLAKFTFAPSEKPVAWNLSGVTFPTVGDSAKPSLPINISLYKPRT
ncbi:cytochrome P450 [Epithele typhae]|uniref:cytochrome P450 n=1 Tax=Epithele typhae TaxID=378194 RepID=UPI002008625B|nr:cytochrome P450 [Epithele typhae]KAH9941860.1 cytochrome P450 [Epithele typhae]